MRWTTNVRRMAAWALAGLALAFPGLSGCGDASSPALPNPALPAAASPASTTQARATDSPIQLTNVTADTQIAFRHTDGNTGQYYVVEIVASGLATFDFDDDGLVDIYFLSGTPLKGASPEAPPGGNALYKNLGNFRFQDVTQRAGVGDAGYGVGVTAGDYDNDGHQDLYLSNFGPKVLYHNRGDGTFENVTTVAGVSNGDQLGAGTCFLDIENDGDLDLFVANYLDFSYEKHVPFFTFGVPVYSGPMNFPPLKHALYRNRGDGTFEDVSAPSGIGEKPSAGMGTICADYDGDGDTDIFVANDVMPNFCFQNDGSGRFTEVGASAGLAYNVDGMVLGNMGVDSADYDHDGHCDFFVTSYQKQLPVLFHNQGGGAFQDVTAVAARAQRSFNNSKWGCGFADFDNDGHKDIFVGIGHLQVNIEKYDETSSYEARPMLLRNNGQGRFEDVTEACGPGMQELCVARGVALEDLDNDGRIDVVISNSRRAPLILQNDSQNSHHWLELRLRGIKANRDAVGAHVAVTAGDLVQFDEVHSGRGYQSHFGSRLHFGLGTRPRIDRVEVHWPGGARDVWTDVAVDQVLTLTEGGGSAK